MLITQQEVIDLAYSEDISADQIPLTQISLAEEIYIKPLLLGNLSNVNEINLTDYSPLMQQQLKLALAFWVRFISFYSQFHSSLSVEEMQAALASTYNQAMSYHKALSLSYFQMHTTPKTGKRLINGFLI